MRFNEAKAVAEIHKLVARLRAQSPEVQAAMLRGHRSVLRDPHAMVEDLATSHAIVAALQARS